MNRFARRAAPCLLLATCLFAAHPASADTRMVAGRALVLATNSSDDLVIATDPSLHGQIRFSSDASLSCLSVVGGYRTVVSTSSCGDDRGTLRVEVSPDAPLTLSSSGDGDIRVADLRGPLTVSLSGSGDLVAGRTGQLVLSARASGDATIGQVDGPATIEMNGDGEVHITAMHGPLTVHQVGSGGLVAGTIEGGDVVLEGSGSGDVLIGGGHIEHLQATMTGSGDLDIAASLRDGNVTMRGGGDARLGPVSGTLNQDATGGSSITVLDAEHARAIDDQAARKISTHKGASSLGLRRGTEIDLEDGLTVAFVVLVLFICWRIVRRSGGLSGLLARRGGAAPPSNPAVLALGETMTRLEQRLGRLESYVTTREFDLARKFRELGPQ